MVGFEGMKAVLGGLGFAAGILGLALTVAGAVAIAQAMERDAISSGKFQGMICAETP